jgi:hypothetical protein
MITVINIMHYPLDASRYYLTPAELQLVDQHGVYVHNYEIILQYYQYDRVMGDMKKLWEEHRSIVLSVEGEGEVAALEGALLLLSRPDIQWVTDVEYLESIPHCDTKTHYEQQRVTTYLYSKSPGMLIRLIYNDGQASISSINEKRRYPDRCKSVLVIPAGMHAYGHDGFSKNQVYSDNFIGWTVQVLGKRKVEPITTNFSDDKWTMLKNHLLEVEPAIQMFFRVRLPDQMAGGWRRMAAKCKHHAGLEAMLYCSLQVSCCCCIFAMCS